jgi:hypothetical protein
MQKLMLSASVGPTTRLSECRPKLGSKIAIATPPARTTKYGTSNADNERKINFRFWHIPAIVGPVVDGRTRLP